MGRRDGNEEVAGVLRLLGDAIRSSAIGAIVPTLVGAIETLVGANRLTFARGSTRMS
jgi:hypothetical protein